jgi:hypothetical protein
MRFTSGSWVLTPRQF